MRRPLPRAGGSAGRETEVAAEVVRVLLGAAQQASPVPASQPPKVLPRRAGKSGAQLAHLRADAERSMRIEAGRRARRLPYQATAATAGAGYAAWGLTELADIVSGPAGQTTATTATAGLCCAGLAALRIYHRYGITQQWRRSWWAAAISAGSWITAASAFGPATWTMTAALGAGAAAISSTWMRAHEVPIPGTAPTPTAPVEPATTSANDLGDDIAVRWAENVSCQGGPVPGSHLTGRQDLPNVIKWLVETPPGKGNFDSLLASLPRIASGLRCSLNKLILEPVAEDESAAWLSVITRDVLAEGVPYTGPRYFSEHSKDGRIPVGPSADGTGEACYVAVDEVGCRNGLVTGAPGSGKSACLETLTLGYLSSGRWWVLFGDGDSGGGSSPLLNRIAHWAEAGPERVLAQLEWLEDYLELRTSVKATLTASPDGTPMPITDPATQLPVREMLPSQQYPGVVWVVDELYRLTQDDWLKDQNFVGRLEKLTRIGRKYGIVVLAGTQSLLLDDYGGSSKLRAYLSDVNCLAYRNRNRSEQHVVSGLKISPSVLPVGGGYGFSTAGGRMSMFRGAWAPDLSPFAKGLAVAPLEGDARVLMDRYRPDESGDPEQLYTSAQARVAELLAAAKTGTRPTPANQPDRASRPAMFPALEGIKIPRPLGAADIIPITRPQHGPTTTKNIEPDTTISPDAREQTLNGLTETQRCVYDTLVSLGTRQPARNAQIVDLSNLSDSTVAKALAALVERGLARRLGHGSWAATRNDADGGSELVG